MLEQTNLLLHIMSPCEKSGLKKSLKKTDRPEKKQAEMVEQGSIREQKTEYLASCILTCYCSGCKSNRIQEDEY